MNDQCLLGQACEAEGKAGPINMNNKAQKANSNLYDIGYDNITWGSPDSPVIPQTTAPSDLTWFGYRHTNSSLQLKRYFSPRDMDEAWESDMVLAVFGPFAAKNREDAMKVLMNIVNNLPQKAHDKWADETGD